MDVLQSRVLLRRRDFDGAVAFYEGQLGLVRYRDWGEAGRRGVVYFLGGGFLEITEAACGDDDRDATPGRGVGSTVGLWLQVADVHAARDELAGRDVAIQAEPEQKPWGLIEMTVVDPAGLELVVIETPTSHPLRRRR